MVTRRSEFRSDDEARAIAAFPGAHHGHTLSFVLERLVQNLPIVAEHVSATELRGFSSVTSELADQGITSLTALEAWFQARVHLETDKDKRWLDNLLQTLRNLAMTRVLEIRAEEKLPAAMTTSPNCAVVDPLVLCSLDRLVAGIDRLNISSFHNLCSLTEAVVLTERLIAPISRMSLAFFGLCLRELQYLDLVRGPSRPDIESAWAAGPVSDTLANNGALSIEETQYGMSDVWKEANWLFIQSPGTWRTQLSSTEHISELWNISLHATNRWEELTAVPSTDESVLDAEDGLLTLQASHLLNLLLAVEADRRGWQVVYDLGSHAINHTPLTAPTRAKQMIAELDKMIQREAEALFAARHLRHIEIPLLTALLLSRCRTREDIPGELLKLRHEFVDLRKALTNYDQRILRCTTIAEFREVDEELTRSWDAILRKITKRQRRVVRRVFDIVKAGNISDILRDLVQKSLAYTEDRMAIGQLRGFIAMWDQASQLKNYDGLVRRCFGTSLEEAEARFYYQLVDQLRTMNVGCPDV